MKSDRCNVMFIHQTLPDQASTPSDSGGPTVVTKKHSRPKKVKLTDHSQQTIVTTPAASSVIKDTTSFSNNGSGMEEACASPTPLQIDLSPSFINNNEQNNTEMIDDNRTLKDTRQDTDSRTIIDHTPMDDGQPLVPSIAPAITKKQRVRRSSTGKASFGVQAKAVEAGLHIKKRRGRKSKAMLQRRGTVLKGVTSPSATSFVKSNSNVIMGRADQGVICSTQSTNHQQATTSMEQRRNMLLMKAKADKAWKRAKARRAMSVLKQEEAIQQRSEKQMQQRN